MNFKDIIVQKPWGFEYSLFHNDKVSIWHLKIKEGQETSLHAHPNKKTGLVILSGGATVSFLSDKFKLFPSEKIMIRQGVFHKTKANVGDVHLLEIETPPNKLDLVRLEDKYGRAGQPYENEDHYTTVENLIQLKEGVTDKIGRTSLDCLTLNKEELIASAYLTYMIIDGSIKSMGFDVAGPGDVLTRENLLFMLDKFDLKESLKVVCISND